MTTISLYRGSSAYEVKFRWFFYKIKKVENDPNQSIILGNLSR